MGKVIYVNGADGQFCYYYNGIYDYIISDSESVNCNNLDVTYIYKVVKLNLETLQETILYESRRES